MQEVSLTEILCRCCELYNACLQEKREAYKKQRVNIARKVQMAELGDVKELRPEYAGIHSQVLQNVIARVHRAFDGFFRRVRSGGAGYPRFKSRERYSSFTFPQVSRKKELVGGGVTLREGRLIIHGVTGKVKIVLHRPWRGLPKTATIKRDGTAWYLFLVCDVPVEPRTKTGLVCGVDVGLEAFATLDDGTVIPNPRFHHQAEPAIVKAQSRMDRRKKGSNRRRKARVLFSKHCRRVANARRDFHHKTSRDLVRKFDQIGTESLSVSGMVRGLHAKSVRDVGWSQFFAILISKAESAGCEVVKVKAAGTSQECAACGAVVRKSLSVRIHDCPECGFRAHRDVNAALNIRQRAFGARPGSGLRGDAMLCAAQAAGDICCRSENLQQRELHVNDAMQH